MFYPDTQRNRVGANYNQLPVNKPNGKSQNVTQYYGAPMNFEVENKYPHFWPQTVGVSNPQLGYVHPALRSDGPAGFYPPFGTFFQCCHGNKFLEEYSDADIYAQARDFLAVVKDSDHLMENMAGGLEKVDSKEVVNKILDMLVKLDQNFGTGVKNILLARINGEVKKTEAENLLQELNVRLLGETVPQRK